MSTALDLISGALRLIGVIASGESATGSEATDALSALNQMLDMWSAEGLPIPNVVRESFPLVGGTSAYTIGTGGNFNTSWPERIVRAGVEISSSPSTELAIELINVEQWADIVNKDTQSSIPTRLYAENKYPLETINLWPVPSVANNLILYCQKPLSSLATTGATLSLMPGYDRAIKYNLAVALAPEFGKEVLPSVIGIAIESKAILERRNDRPFLMDSDAIGFTRGGAFNFYTGDN